jgi:hypothetical protein
MLIVRAVRDLPVGGEIFMGYLNLDMAFAEQRKRTEGCIRVRVRLQPVPCGAKRQQGRHGEACSASNRNKVVSVCK